MGKLTISMAMFNSYVSLPEGNLKNREITWIWAKKPGYKPGRDILWQWERIGCKFNFQEMRFDN